jgi:chromosome partitioning protein
MGKSISVVNQKGGVGKSTTAINVAAYLAKAGKKTLLVDIDPQSNATSGLGINLTNGPSVYHTLIGESKASEVMLQTQVKNLWLIPSTIELAGAEIELVAAFSREYKLKKALEEVKNQFDFIIIDSPPSLGLLTVNALAAADELIIPIQCEYYALEGVSKLMDTIKLVRNNLNPELEIMGVLLTMYDTRTRLSHQVSEEVRNYFGDLVFKTVVPRNIRLSEAPSYGQPILIYDPTSKGAEAYRKITREVIRRA